MGFDLNRFEGDVDEELMCTICSCVLEEPLQAPQCEHAFCAACINEWLTRQPTCPVDRAAISPADLKPVPRILRNLLARLTIKCENAAQGCTASIKLDSLASHLNECEFNPKKPVSCELGCGSTIPKDELSTHNCVKELRSALQASNNKLTNVQIQVTDLKKPTERPRQETALSWPSNCKCLFISSHIVSTSCLSPLDPNAERVHAGNEKQQPRIREIHADVENDEILRWVSTLQPARVTRWGGMISTPDAVLQAVIKRALIDSGCPDHIIQELMENATREDGRRASALWKLDSYTADSMKLRD
ncbi:RNF41 [Bugula neritina]|uniref:E3 ubiquitin-protein ligase NRDP1 n=1 Tax=Bugula neritina TaxID=10212 RepID=A0A7J7K0T9_BUGNE|nr:RNF41 [Bugula neritina]